MADIAVSPFAAPRVVESDIAASEQFEAIDIPEQRQLLDADPMTGESLAFPLTLSPKEGTQVSASQLAEWTKRNSKSLLRLALRHGAVLIRGCDVAGADDFSGVVASVACEGYTSFGGTALRSTVIAGLVSTANDAPPHEWIPYHHENGLVPNPSSYVIFYCDTPAAEGGATPIVHSAEVAAFLDATYPDFVRKVEEIGVRYVRVMPYETDRTSFFGRSWRETYKVETETELEEVLKQLNIAFEWLGDGDLKTTTHVYPPFRLDGRSGKRVFFNSVYGVYFGWNNARNVGEKSVVFGDGSPLPADVMNGLRRFVEEREVAFKWQHGDVLLLDNTLVMHSRQPFKGTRRILVGLRGPALEPVVP